MTRQRFQSVADKVAHDNAALSPSYLNAAAIADALKSKAVALAPGVFLRARYANRHGLIAGATGSGKTVTLQTLAEGFSKIGVPVFMADVKGDIAGLATSTAPVRFLDCYGERGSPLNLTIDRLGPAMLSRALGLSDVQSAVVDIIFAYARAKGLQLNSIDEFRKALCLVSQHKESISANLGQVSNSSLGVIQRALLRLAELGAIDVFKAPAFDPATLLEIRDNAGVISILSAERLIRTPQLYAITLLWLLSDLFDRLPEVGDLDKPRLVFVFDEAHLLFDNCPAALLERIEQIIRLVRSKGIGVYFASQAPADIPSTILGQLGNRVQHALRAATAKDQKEIRAAADTLPNNAGLDVAELIATMAPGTALVSVIGANGAPQPVELARINLPACRLGPISEDERAKHVEMPRSPIAALAAGRLRDIPASLLAKVAFVIVGGWSAAILCMAGMGLISYALGKLTYRGLFWLLNDQSWSFLLSAFATFGIFMGLLTLTIRLGKRLGF